MRYSQNTLYQIMKQTANFDNVLNEVQGSMKSFKENVFFYNNHESELNIFSHS